VNEERNGGASPRPDEIDTEELEQLNTPGQLSTPRATGRRSQRMAARRRARERRQLLMLVVAGLLLALLTCERIGSSAGRGTEETLLLISHPSGTGVSASSVTLLVVGPQEHASVLFLPVSMVMELPGFGLNRLATAYRYGGAPLVETTVESLLGIDVDHTSALEDPGLPGLFRRIDGLQIDLPRPLVTQPVEELAFIARQESAFRTLLSALKDRRTRAAALAESASQLGVEPDWLGKLFARLADAAADGRVVYTLLPVHMPDGRGSYQVDENALRTVMQ
jgi:hypothetical protein